MPRERILKNSLQCLFCKDIIESTYRHDFQRCRCGGCAVDGGLDYVKWAIMPGAKFKDLSVYETLEECQNTDQNT
jgi:hypothetical protein